MNAVFLWHVFEPGVADGVCFGTGRKGDCMLKVRMRLFSNIGQQREKRVNLIVDNEDQMALPVQMKQAAAETQVFPGLHTPLQALMTSVNN